MYPYITRPAKVRERLGSGKDYDRFGSGAVL